MPVAAQQKAEGELAALERDPAKGKGSQEYKDKQQEVADLKAKADAAFKDVAAAQKPTAAAARVVTALEKEVQQIKDTLAPLEIERATR